LLTPSSARSIGSGKCACNGLASETTAADSLQTATRGRRKPIHNADIARVFEEIADLPDIGEANPFHVRELRGWLDKTRGAVR
jgi:hypothetical protein